MTPFDVAADALYACALSAFVAERKRLAAELRAGGDKAGAAALNKLGRPGQSAWAVNQLWRQARGEWDALLAATVRLAKGELAAASEQRTALAALRAKAIEALKAEGSAASEPVLARVDTNLRAIAATGWADVAPGRLVDDRAAPGFEALAGFAAIAPPASAPVDEVAAMRARQQKPASTSDERAAETTAPREATPPSSPVGTAASKTATAHEPAPAREATPPVGAGMSKAPAGAGASKGPTSQTPAPRDEATPQTVPAGAGASNAPAKQTTAPPAAPQAAAPSGEEHAAGLAKQAAAVRSAELQRLTLEVATRASVAAEARSQVELAAATVATIEASLAEARAAHGELAARATLAEGALAEARKQLADLERAK